jgi:hypothetical protein
VVFKYAIAPYPLSKDAYTVKIRKSLAKDSQLLKISAFMNIWNLIRIAQYLIKGVQPLVVRMVLKIMVTPMWVFSVRLKSVS